MFVFCVLIYIGGLSYKIIGAVLAILIPSAIIFINLIMQEGQQILDEYQFKRIMAWLNPAEYADDAYQQQNSIIAIGSGQLYGKGLYNNDISSVKNGNFIVEPQTDFIFAVTGEELGFIGCAAIIILLALIVMECLWIGKNARENDHLLRNRRTDRISEPCQYMRGYRTDAEYRYYTALCKLWAYIACYAVYGDRDCFKYRASAQKILTRGSNHEHRIDCA